MDENKEPREMLENMPENAPENLDTANLGDTTNTNGFEASDMPTNEALEDNILYSWSEVDYIKKTRSPIWYILFVLVIIALSVVSVVFMKSW